MTDDPVGQQTRANDDPAFQSTSQTGPHRSVAHDAVSGHRRRWLLWVVLAAVVLSGAYYFVPRVATAPRDSSGSSPSGKGAAGAPRSAPAVPVVAAKARLGDMPIYLSGLGSVLAFQTVSVRSRVDGQLVSVAFREGQLVREGELLAQIDPRPFQVQLEQAQGQLAKDQAALKNAQLDLERYRALLSNDAIPRQQFDTQAATVTQVQGAIKTDEAQVSAATLNLTYARIKAPITGRIGLRQVDVGNIVHATDQNGIVTITQVQPIAVVFPLPEDDLPQVLPKMRAGQRLVVEAWDHDLKHRLATGSLLTTDNEIDQGTATFKAKAVFPNEDESLFPNQFVNARLLVNTLRGVIIVPSAAVQRSPQSTFVWVVRPDGSVEMRPCDVRATEGDESVVDGVAAGDTVVTDGVDRLQQGTKVAMQMAGGNRPASGTNPQGRSATNPQQPPGAKAQPSGTNARPHR
jgi:membrane fusion protein, multidrug efflux system